MSILVGLLQRGPPVDACQRVRQPDARRKTQECSDFSTLKGWVSAFRLASLLALPLLLLN